MFDLSFAEIALAGFAAIVAVKPDDMPGFLRGCGKKWRAFRQWRGEWTSEMRDMLDPEAASSSYRIPKRDMYVPEGSDEAFERYILDDDSDDRDEDISYNGELQAEDSQTQETKIEARPVTQTEHNG